LHACDLGLDTFSGRLVPHELWILLVALKHVHTGLGVLAHCVHKDGWEELGQLDGDTWTVELVGRHARKHGGDGETHTWAARAAKHVEQEEQRALEQQLADDLGVGRECVQSLEGKLVPLRTLLNQDEDVGHDAGLGNRGNAVLD